MSHMRQKRKERGRLEREAAAPEVEAPGGDAQLTDALLSDALLGPDEVAEAGESSLEDLPETEGLETLEAEADDEAELLPEADAAAAGIADLDSAKFKALVEALIFASDKPVTLVRLKQLTRVKDTARVQATLDELVADYKERGIALQSISGGYMFRTQSAYSGWVQQLIAGRPVRLSRAQLETLAIIAYRQPITRPEIDDIRGVDSGGTLKVLLDRGLIRILGKKEEVGRPLLYGTTKEFLDFFSLADLRELPTLREYSELSEEHRRVVDDELGEEEDAPVAAALAPEPAAPAPAPEPDAAIDADRDESAA